MFLMWTPTSERRANRERLQQLRVLCQKARHTPAELTSCERRRLALNVALVIPSLSVKRLPKELHDRLVRAELYLFLAEHGPRLEGESTGLLFVSLNRLKAQLADNKVLLNLISEGREAQAYAYVKRSYRNYTLNALRDEREEHKESSQRSSAVDPLCTASSTPELHLEELESAWSVPEDVEALLEVIHDDQALRDRGGALLYILALPVRLRACYCLKYALCLSAAEIGERLNITVNAVNLRNFHARALIEELVAQRSNVER